jgi:hypothetical protein
MNKKIVSGLLAATLLAGGTSAFAETTAQTTVPATTQTTKHEFDVKGLENALQHVKNQTARQAILANIQKQNATTTADSINVTTTSDSVTVTPAPAPVNVNVNVIVVKLNGKIMVFDQKPMIVNGRTVVPLRAIFEALGANIEWDGKNQTVKAMKGKNKIMVKIGDTHAVKNGKKVKLDQKAIIVNKRTMVPLRFVSEALGAKVEWDAKNATVHIHTQVK